MMVEDTEATKARLRGYFFLTEQLFVSLKTMVLRKKKITISKINKKSKKSFLTHFSRCVLNQRKKFVSKTLI